MRGRTVAVTWRDLPATDEMSALVRFLPPAERERRAEMAEERQRAFVGGRALARQVLGVVLGVAPQDVPIQLDGERPLLPVATGLWISISHSGPVVACAVARRPVGLDVEEPSGREPEDSLLRRVCAPREIDRVRRSGDPEAVFLRLWVRKEAVAKALGLGLDAGFPTLHVDSPLPVRAGGGRWRVRDLVVGGLPAAVAARGVGWWLQMRRG